MLSHGMGEDGCPLKGVSSVIDCLFKLEWNGTKKPADWKCAAFDIF